MNRPDKASRMEKAEKMISKVVNLPTIPETMTRVTALLDDPDVELDEVAEVILTDQVMASRVIKIVNSPMFRPMHQIKSLKRALIYLGFRRIREIALTCSIIKTFEGKEGVFDVKTFWEHSFGVGIVSKIIAQRVRYPETEKAYICGIVHDIGEVFLSSYLSEEFQKIVDLIKGTCHSFAEGELFMLGTTHCDLGFCLAKKWNFPLEYCDVIENHHTPQDATFDPMLVAIVNLADLFCSVRNLNYDNSEWVSFSLTEEKSWEILQRYSPNFSDLDVEKFCFELDEKVMEIEEMVRSIFEK
ncbi:MAG TPA: HDOD domain-containing protein [Geobacteraceae bacterium]|nr:HDOD domain-containing protein [Geobacteraceae bacterium]